MLKLTILDGMLSYFYHFDFVQRVSFAMDNRVSRRKNVNENWRFSEILQASLQIVHRLIIVHGKLPNKQANKKKTIKNKRSN